MVDKKRRAELRHKIRYHVQHKSKLTFLLIVKAVLVLAVALLVILTLGNYLNQIMGIVPAFIISFAVACAVYLFLIVKVLDWLKF